MAQIQRITSDKISEVVEVRYYPKSFEIKTVSRAANGNKSATTVYGNESGGKIKAKNLSGSITDIVA